ncbi:carboxylesterase [Actibacterium sp. 188UL27-1]|uniref:alpha/beta hydrolase n=1 Tax=Actibacterium sp. 188UL27-1 TaxID=2786961 RepID=UPI00195D9648|nr:alpha/beta hydrolase [Actibacterium sp. 188UL27-1]MBM7068279.1 alpha/beta hydrolase [Actibacterium sp. 188UL27-1]
METPQIFETPHGRRLAFHQTEGSWPGLVFLGGFKSDMTGTKAVHLEAWAKARGMGFLRFDYSGHGQSSEVFEEGSIGEWADDAQAIIAARTAGPQVLIGSSMGGWIALLMTKAIPKRIAGLVTIAAAPDFTEDSMWASFDVDQRAALERDGQIALPSDYGDPYIITRRLIEEGRNSLVLRDLLDLPFPVRFLQGTADADVSMDVALRLLDHATGPDMRLVLLKGGDHRFSDLDALKLIEDAVENVLQSVKDHG